MSKFILTLGFGIAASIWPTLAQAQTVSLKPGLYDYSHVFNLGGQDVSADEYEYCLREGENSKTLDELVESLSSGGECKLSNVSMTRSTGRADIACTDTGLGMDIRGTIEAEFGSDFYDVNAFAAFGPLQLVVKSKVRRRGECPVNWKNPDDVSAE